MIKLLSRAFGYLMLMIYKLVGNYGISIIILSAIVRAAMLPMYANQNKQQAKMAALQPEIAEINKRYARDRNAAALKTQELYDKNGINPYSGCLPLLIQMPVIMGLFALLRDPLSYIQDSSMIIAVHESFLWVPDLCQPDNWILPILAGLTTYFSFSAMSSAGGAMSSMNMMKYFYPVMLFLMGRSFPAGLALYWAVGNLFTIGQNVFMANKRKKEDFKAAAVEEAKKNIEKKKKDNTK